LGDKAVTWNPLLKSIIDLSEKLEELGIAYKNGTHKDRHAPLSDKA
jgi:hypothetical protein